MSFFKAVSKALSGGGSQEEFNVALAAAGTSLTSMISGDPLTAGVVQLGFSCCFNETRNRGTMAGIGAATMLGLVFGPIGGTVVTGSLLLCNRVSRASIAEAELELSAAPFMERDSARVHVRSAYVHNA